MKENGYLLMKKRHSNGFNNFPCFFAFNDKQFNEGMVKIGLDPKDSKMVYKNSTGMIYRKTESKNLKNLFERHEKEMNCAIKKDKTGHDFIFDMFSYELSNHEYCITCDESDTLDSLGLSYCDILASDALINGLKLAKVEAMQDY